MVVVVCVRVCVCVEGGRGHIFQLRRITVTPIIQSIYRLWGERKLWSRPVQGTFFHALDDLGRQSFDRHARLLGETLRY